MMDIEGHWETIDTLEDVSRVIRDYYNYELANELDKLIEKFDPIDNGYVEQLEETIDEIRRLVC